MPTVQVVPSSRFNNYWLTWVGGYNQSNKWAVMNQLTFGPTTVFVFPYAPVEVNFENISASYEEVKRAGKYPTLAFSGYQLTKAALNFRLANRASGGQVNVEYEIQTLRAMATVPFPVYFTGGVDNMLLQGVRAIRGRSAAWWRITDMSINILARDLDNKATQADVQMTMTEERNPSIPVVFLPPITYNDYPPRKADITGSVRAGITFTGADGDPRTPE
jgi:hypothetical protein